MDTVATDTGYGGQERGRALTVSLVFTAMLWPALG